MSIISIASTDSDISVTHVLAPEETLELQDMEQQHLHTILRGNSDWTDMAIRDLSIHLHFKVYVIVSTFGRFYAGYTGGEISKVTMDHNSSRTAYTHPRYSTDGTTEHWDLVLSIQGGIDKIMAMRLANLLGRGGTTTGRKIRMAFHAIQQGWQSNIVLQIRTY